MEITPLPISVTNGGAIPQGAPQAVSGPRIVSLGLQSMPHTMTLGGKLHVYEPVNPYGDRTVTTAVDDITVRIIVNRVIGPENSNGKTPQQDSTTLIVNERVVTTRDSINGSTQTTTTTTLGGDDASQNATADQLKELQKLKQTSAATYTVDITDQRKVSTEVFSTDLRGEQHVSLQQAPSITIEAKPVTGLLATTNSDELVAAAPTLAQQLANKYAALDEFQSLHLITQVSNEVNA